MVGLVVPDRKGGGRVGVCVRAGGAMGEGIDGAVKFLFTAGPFGGPLRAAGPRGGDLDEAPPFVSMTAGRGPSRIMSFCGPFARPRRGDSSRDCRGERALMELGRGEDRPEAD